VFVCCSFVVVVAGRFRKFRVNSQNPPVSFGGRTASSVEGDVLGQYDNALVIYYGWLTKMGGRIKTWKRRFFVLTPTSLDYFKSTSDNEPIGLAFLSLLLPPSLSLSLSLSSLSLPLLSLSLLLSLSSRRLSLLSSSLSFLDLLYGVGGNAFLFCVFFFLYLFAVLFLFSSFYSNISTLSFSLLSLSLSPSPPSPFLSLSLSHTHTHTQV